MSEHSFNTDNATREFNKTNTYIKFYQSAKTVDNRYPALLETSGALDQLQAIDNYKLLHRTESEQCSFARKQIPTKTFLRNYITFPRISVGNFSCRPRGEPPRSDASARHIGEIVKRNNVTNSKTIRRYAFTVRKLPFCYLLSGLYSSANRRNDVRW